MNNKKKGKERIGKVLLELYNFDKNQEVKKIVCYIELMDNIVVLVENTVYNYDLDHVPCAVILNSLSLEQCLPLFLLASTVES